MIRKLLTRVFGRSDPVRGQPGKARIYKESEHGIRRESISACARKVTTQLQEAGFKAYVVGGAVRDLLLGREPKDFDVATDATPEEIRRVIRRSRVIGRRFQIVHALCGNEVVEVSTFRAHGGADADDRESRSDEHGRLVRDNVFGNMIEDAARRDFTINALFYDPAKEEIWDFYRGVADVRAKMLRVIGDPAQRYREDPVRMLRVARFAAKLGFKLDAAARAPLGELAPLLANVPSARLFDEMLKLLLSGHSVECVRQLRQEGLHHGLLPLLDVILEQPLGERFVNLTLEQTDARVAQDKPVSPAFLFAALLWHEVLAASQAHERAGAKPLAAVTLAMDEVFEAQREILAIPRRFNVAMKELWGLQPRFLHRSGARPFRLLEHARFRAAYDFLLLRCASGEVAEEVGQWWTRFQEADDAGRAAMLFAEERPKSKRRRGPRRKSAADVDGVKAADAPALTERAPHAADKR